MAMKIVSSSIVTDLLMERQLNYKKQCDGN